MSHKESPIPEDVQKLFQKHNRMKFFIAQYQEEWDLLDKVKEACSDLATHKAKAKHLSLYGPGQPSQIQIKLDVNEWTTAQNNAMMKQDLVEVYLKDYKRQMGVYEQEIIKRGYPIPTQVPSSASLTVIPERSPAGSARTAIS